MRDVADPCDSWQRCERVTQWTADTFQTGDPRQSLGHGSQGDLGLDGSQETLAAGYTADASSHLVFFKMLLQTTFLSPFGFCVPLIAEKMFPLS